jgi:hypothetical protein
MLMLGNTPRFDIGIVPQITEFNSDDTVENLYEEIEQ